MKTASEFSRAKGIIARVKTITFATPLATTRADSTIVSVPWVTMILRSSRFAHASAIFLRCVHHMEAVDRTTDAGR
jgi:hypothetical protein